MKTILTITFLFSSVVYGQPYKKFHTLSLTQLSKLKNSFPKEYYEHFLALLSKRDTIYLKQQLSSTKSNKIYFVEAYNFETNKYSLFEEYKEPKSINPSWSLSIFYLDKERINDMSTSYFLFDTARLLNNNFVVDTIFPRKYRYGGGCVISDTTFQIFHKLEEKAKTDGIVIEKYCRIETLIDKATNKIFIKYSFPVKGQREFKNLGVGFTTDYPPGLDFWLFASPYIVEQ